MNSEKIKDLARLLVKGSTVLGDKKNCGHLKYYDNGKVTGYSDCHYFESTQNVDNCC